MSGKTKVLYDLHDFPTSLRGCAVSLGNFDGVHLGHARMIERLKAISSRLGCASLVFTFDPPPTRVLRPSAAPEPLMWNERKIELLSELGVDAVLIYPTTKDFLEQSAKNFFEEVICGHLNASAMVEGVNFFFGHNRSGNVDTLRQFCAEKNMLFEVVEPLEIDGWIVSSSRIRALITEGQVEEAARMLGRPYRIRGRVIRGAGRGRTLGFPTANVGYSDTLLPGEGIYAAQARVGDKWYAAAVCLGPNPTFGERNLKVEVFILHFDRDIYDWPIEVDFFARLRDIKRFNSVNELIEQITRDVEKVVKMAD